MTPSYDFWHARLAGEAVDQPEQPQPGRYRLPARRTNTTGNVNTKPPKSHPVAIWFDDLDGRLRAKIGRTVVITEGSGDAWHEFVGGAWLSCIAVPAEQYDAVVNGGSWPDESDVVTKHNAAPPDDSFEAISERINDLCREALAMVKVGAAPTQEASDRAADLANLIGQLEKKADDLRRVEKKPFEEQAKEVDRRWNPVRDKAAEAKKLLKLKVCTPFLEAQRKAQEEARFQATLTGTPDDQLPSAKVTAGSRGRPVALRTIKRAEIVDRAAVLAHFAEHEEISGLLQTLADRAIRAGFQVPGVKVIETQQAA